MNDLKKYMREVSALLECPKKEKKYYLSVIENECAEGADCLSYEELLDRLGSPREWVDAHLEIVGGENYESKVANLKRKRKVLTLIITALVILIAATTIYICIKNERARGFEGDYSDPIIISTEE